jgi:hypothetical protein
MTRRGYEKLMPWLVLGGVVFMLLYALMRPFLG